MDGSNIPLVAETRIIANLELIRWLAAIDSAPLLDWAVPDCIRGNGFRIRNGISIIDEAEWVEGWELTR